MSKTCYFWFRRDLRLDDNIGLYHALKNHENVQPIFILVDHILNHIENNDPRVSFIYDRLKIIDAELHHFGSSLLVKRGDPLQIFKTLNESKPISAIYSNSDYEPYAISRDYSIYTYCENNNIEFKQFKDSVIFEKNEITKEDKHPYHVFSAYKKKWLSTFHSIQFKTLDITEFSSKFAQSDYPFLEISYFNLVYNPKVSPIPEINEEFVRLYDQQRDYPSLDATTRLGIHLRFGTLSIRGLAQYASNLNQTFLNELIWREFFKMLLFFYPKTVNQAFNPRYKNMKWEENESYFEKWTNGQTGYAMVDAGMRELNQTGFMHNRVRMICASFLCRHLLLDWKLGERYFAQHLLDYDKSANVGNWQWASGTGCDAAPYFRVFNPDLQQQRFDPKFEYIRKYVPEFDSPEYKKMVDHKTSRARAISYYKAYLDHEKTR